MQLTACFGVAFTQLNQVCPDFARAADVAGFDAGCRNVLLGIRRNAVSGEPSAQAPLVKPVRLDDPVNAEFAIREALELEIRSFVHWSGYWLAGYLN